MPDKEDWRRMGQEEYLNGITLTYKQYSDRITKTDHDHCEFCFERFCDCCTDSLKSGYTTEDNYCWICDKCFEDFKEEFSWTIN